MSLIIKILVFCWDFLTMIYAKVNMNLRTRNGVMKAKAILTVAPIPPILETTSTAEK